MIVTLTARSELRMGTVGLKNKLPHIVCTQLNNKTFGNFGGLKYFGLTLTGKFALTIKLGAI
jgi:hypothetical protein